MTDLDKAREAWEAWRVKPWTNEELARSADNGCENDAYRDGFISGYLAARQSPAEGGDGAYDYTREEMFTKIDEILRWTDDDDNPMQFSRDFVKNIRALLSRPSPVAGEPEVGETSDPVIAAGWLGSKVQCETACNDEYQPSRYVEEIDDVEELPIVGILAGIAEDCVWIEPEGDRSGEATPCEWPVKLVERIVKEAEK